MPKTEVEFPDNVSTNLPAGWRDRARKLAKRRGWNLAQWIRRAIMLRIEWEEAHPWPPADSSTPTRM